MGPSRLEVSLDQAGQSCSFRPREAPRGGSRYMNDHLKAPPPGRAFFMWLLVTIIGMFWALNPGVVQAQDNDAMTVEEAERLGEEFGIVVGEVDEEIRKELGLVRAQGVVVFEVIGGTQADYAGMKVRAVVKEIDKMEVRTMLDFGRALKKAKNECGFTVGTYEPASPENQGVGGVINFHLVRCLKD